MSKRAEMLQREYLERMASNPPAVKKVKKETSRDIKIECEGSFWCKRLYGWPPKVPIVLNWAEIQAVLKT